MASDPTPAADTEKGRRLSTRGSSGSWSRAGYFAPAGGPEARSAPSPTCSTGQADVGTTLLTRDRDLGAGDPYPGFPALGTGGRTNSSISVCVARGTGGRSGGPCGPSLRPALRQQRLVDLLDPAHRRGPARPAAGGSHPGGSRGEFGAAALGCTGPEAGVPGRLAWMLRGPGCCGTPAPRSRPTTSGGCCPGPGSVSSRSAGARSRPAPADCRRPTTRDWSSSDGSPR